MQNVKQQKQELRKKYKEKRRAVSHTQKLELDTSLCRNITDLACFKRAHTLLLFYPSFQEPDLLGVAREALKMGKKIAFPLCDTETRTMTFRYVTSFDELMAGSYSIPEPPADAPMYDGNANTVCVVPALSFDKDGYRLGYGGGYYDKFLKNFSGISIGAVYADFLCDALPRGYYDISVDILVSERGECLTNVRKNKGYFK